MGWDGQQYFGQALKTTWGKPDSHCNQIYDPAEYLLARQPGGMTVEELLDGNRFGVVDGIVGSQRSKDMVDCCRKDAAGVNELLSAALGLSDKVVNKNVDNLELLLESW